MLIRCHYLRDLLKRRNNKFWKILLRQIGIHFSLKNSIRLEDKLLTKVIGVRIEVQSVSIIIKAPGLIRDQF